MRTLRQCTKHVPSSSDENTVGFEGLLDCAQHVCPLAGNQVAKIKADSPVPIFGSMLRSAAHGFPTVLWRGGRTELYY